MAANQTRLLPYPRPFLRVAGFITLITALLLGGCRPAASPQGTAPPSPPEATTPTPEPSAPPPTGSPTTNRLPNTLMKEWQPLSKVLAAFGPMTISAGQVQWSSGQTSAYSLVSMDGGYLLKLEASPTFYDGPTPYIKLIPKPEASASVEVAFYTHETQLKDDEYVMYGSYFAE